MINLAQLSRGINMLLHSLNNTCQKLKQILSKTAILLVALSVIHTPTAFAKAATKVVATPEHLHVGQKIANYFRSFGIPDVAILAIISAMPVVELRGAIPVGIWMDLPITTVLAASVLGNMIPIVPLLFLLKNQRLQ